MSLELDIPEYSLAQHQLRVMEADIAAFVSCVKNKKLCLQAGGAVGNYPAILSRHFEQVVTIEANRDNYAFMSRNLKDYANIKIIHSGLWNASSRGSTQTFRPGNVLTNYIIPGDDVPLITIDSLELEPNLIWLDIEGSEFKALSGATKTLQTCNAVIIEEAHKGLEGHVGDSENAARELLESLGFKQQLRRALDTLFVR